MCRPYSVLHPVGFTVPLAVAGSRGALLPHPFDLTAPKNGGLLSVALSLTP